MEKTMKHVMTDVHRFVISSIVGALVYSVEFVNGLSSFIGLDITFQRSDA